MADQKLFEPRPISPEEELVAAGPAVLCNRAFASVGPYGVRLAFAEQFSDSTGPLFRSAVVLPHSDAIRLAQILDQLLEPIKKAMLEAGVPIDGQ